MLTRLYKLYPGDKFRFLGFTEINVVVDKAGMRTIVDLYDKRRITLFCTMIVIKI